MLNILCDVIRDVIDKHVYVTSNGFNRVGNRTVSELTTGFSYSSEGWTYRTTFD